MVVSLLYVQLSYPYMTTVKIIALTTQTFVGKAMSLLSILFRFVTAFLQRGKHLSNFMAAVTVPSDFGAQENKVCHGFPLFPISLPLSDGTRYHYLHFLNVEFQASFFRSPLSSSSRASLVSLCFLP